MSDMPLSVESKFPMAEPKEITEQDIDRAVEDVIRQTQEERLSATPSAIVESANATTLSRLKNLVPKKARHVLRLSAQKAALTAGSLYLLISSACGNVDNPSIAPTDTLKPTPISSPIPDVSPRPVHKTSVSSTRENNIVTENAEKIIQDIESEFQVQILTPDELLEVELARIKRPLEGGFIFLPYPGLLDKKFPVAEWNTDNALELKGILNELPPNFYLPFPSKTIEIPLAGVEVGADEFYPLFVDWMRYNLNDETFTMTRQELDAVLEKGSYSVVINKRPVQFILADVSSAHKQTRENIRGICNCHDMISGHQIIFPKDKFESGDFDSNLSIAVHELTHRVTHPDREDFYANFVARSLNLTNWNQYQKAVANKIINARSNLSEIEIKKLEVAERYWGEFIPVASEFYIRGKKKFSKVYTPFVGESEALKLYEFMKDEVFLGKEYKTK